MRGEGLTAADTTSSQALRGLSDHQHQPPPGTQTERQEPRAGGVPGSGLGAGHRFSWPGIPASDPETPDLGSLSHTVGRKEGTEWPGGAAQD